MNPAFFQQFDHLIQLIPHHPQASGPLATLIEDYLKHYGIHFVEAGCASTYQIWQSHIGPYRIVEQRWQPQQDKGKTLIVLHGYFDHSGLFGKLIRWGLEQGYQVHCFDLPGHGLSSGEAGAIGHFDQYSHILATIINREGYQDYEIIGQSTGCAVALNCLFNCERQASKEQGDNEGERLQHWPAKMTLLAPLVRVRYWPLLRWLYYLLRPFVGHIRRSFSPSSHDVAFNDFLKEDDPLQTKTVPLCWIGAMDLWAKKIKKVPPVDKEIESVIIQGNQDSTVDWRYNHQVIRQRLPQTQIHMVDQARHQLVNESDAYWHGVVAHLQ